MSWKVPLSMLSTACWPTGAPGHSWGIVASGSMSIGHKGMMYAAKVMAISALDLYTKPEKLKEVRAEFEKETGKMAYYYPVPDHVNPPYIKHPLR
jgi:aminobenzoyl-glutamate utilization protein B